MKENFVDYTSSVQTYSYEENGAKYPFTIYDDLYPEGCDGDEAALDFTGNKKVIAITSIGTIFLTLERKNGYWSADDLLYRNDSLIKRINEVLTIGHRFLEEEQLN
jgi:hypothetical protein